MKYLKYKNIIFEIIFSNIILINGIFAQSDQVYHQENDKS